MRGPWTLTPTLFHLVSELRQPAQGCCAVDSHKRAGVLVTLRGDILACQQVHRELGEVSGCLSGDG
jgi:hypothetical protein